MVHYSAAVILFVCIAFVAWACSEETLVQLPEPQRRYFRTAYTTIAVLMLVAPAAVIVMTRIFGISDKWIFAVETAGIVMFSAYWGLKSYELSKSNADEKALRGEPLRRPKEKPSLRMKAARLLD
jgi:predicted membrane-bound mannosyltransferase